MNKYIIINKFQELDEKEWDNFVNKHPNGNIFQTSRFFKIYNKTENFYPSIIAIISKNKILGVQVSVIIKNYSNVLSSLTARSIIYGGPLVLDENKEVMDIILTEYLTKIKSEAVFSQFRNMKNWGSLKEVFINKNIIYNDHLDIIFDLRKGEKKLMDEISRGRKKGIRESIKRGVKVKVINLNDEIIFDKTFEILLNVYDKIRLPLPDKSFFRNSIIELENEIIGIGAFVDNELVGVRIALCYNDLVYDWYAGALNEYLKYRPNDVMPLELMKWAIKNKFKTFDFGGAGKPDIPYGVRDFKLKFGGKLMNYGRFEIVHKPLLMKIAKLGLKIKVKFGI